MAEHVQAKTLNVDGMYFGRMVTGQGDVAYHFLLKDDSEVFQEGTVYGVLESPGFISLFQSFFNSRKFVPFYILEID